jgi:NADPH-dependent curcumin reductase CurA
MSQTYQTVVLAKRPTDNIVPGETFKLIKDNKLPATSDLKDGEVIFETNYLSVDPAMRGWLNDKRSYVPPVQIGEVMRGMAIWTVKASKDENLPVGSFATGIVGWTELKVGKEGKAMGDLQRIEIPKGGQLTDGLSVLGEFAILVLHL